MPCTVWAARAQLIFNVIESFSQVIFGIINMIMRLAPIGAFGAMAFTIGKYGVGTLVQLGQLIICFYITCILFVVVVLGSIARATASASSNLFAISGKSC
ncbi:Aerobic C4-dicarboxylate transporter [Klebsiella pneumoniae]|uniref:Aerobic C4-dicarboxylate transporter n=1 Tax=Klebsiella pneumoniae TaxID=573 RepID=A0A3S5DHL8_KLEPN|nr:Aerobic C4-dicarboxylate transporter [Klebsiella pneumoniae]